MIAETNAPSGACLTATPEFGPYGGAARPENPAPLAESDIYEACRDFVLAYALPALEPNNVPPAPGAAGGPENGLAERLESGGDLAVIRVLASRQHGTTVELFSAPNPDPAVPGELRVQGLLETRVRVDFYASSDLARQRAQRLAVLFRSGPGADFFSERGISALYASKIKEVTRGSGGETPCRRYAVILHLAYWAGETLEMEYFATADMARLENVDAHHKRFSAI